MPKLPSEASNLSGMTIIPHSPLHRGNKIFKTISKKMLAKSPCAIKSLKVKKNCAVHPGKRIAFLKTKMKNYVLPISSNPATVQCCLQGKNGYDQIKSITRNLFSPCIQTLWANSSANKEWHSQEDVSTSTLSPLYD